MERAGGREKKGGRVRRGRFHKWKTWTSENHEILLVNQELGESKEPRNSKKRKSVVRKRERAKERK